jgi:hypothetical protein
VTKESNDDLTNSDWGVCRNPTPVSTKKRQVGIAGYSLAGTPLVVTVAAEVVVSTSQKLPGIRLLVIEAFPSNNVHSQRDDLNPA